MNRKQLNFIHSSDTYTQQNHTIDTSYVSIIQRVVFYNVYAYDHHRWWCASVCMRVPCNIDYTVMSWLDTCLLSFMCIQHAFF